jgi:hypothetical protein
MQNAADREWAPIPPDPYTLSTQRPVDPPASPGRPLTPASPGPPVMRQPGPALNRARSSYNRIQAPSQAPVPTAACAPARTWATVALATP